MNIYICVHIYMGETDSNIYVELSKQSHNNFEKEQYIWWTNSICLRASLKNYSGQDSGVLTSKEPSRSLEQNRKSRHGPAYMIYIL